MVSTPTDDATLVAAQNAGADASSTEAAAIAQALTALTRKGGLNAQQVTDIVQQELSRLPMKQTVDEDAVRRIATEVVQRHINRVQVVDREEKPIGDTIDNAHAYLRVALHVMQQGIPLLLVGGKGVGKTTLAGQLARGLGRNFAHISCSVATTPGKLLGYPNPVNGQWLRGEITTHLATPTFVLVDEIDGTDPGVQIAVNSISANRYVGEPTGIVHAHEDFGLIAAANTIYGATRAYNGRNKLDDAFLDRFAVLELHRDNAIEARLADIVEPSKLNGDPALGGFYTKKEWLADVRAVIQSFSRAQLDGEPSGRAVEYGCKLINVLGKHWLRELFLYRAHGEDVRSVIAKTLEATW